MKGKFISIILITVLIGAFSSGCVGNPKSETQPTPTVVGTSTPATTTMQTAANSQELSGTITLSGAFALYPMAVRWGDEFTKLHPNVKVEISAGGAGKGMADTVGELVEHGAANEVFENPKEERTRAYINGTFLSDVKIDEVINTKGNVCPYNFVYAKQALHKMDKGKILKVIVDDPTAVTEVPRGMEADGHEVLSVKQRNKTDWEIVIRKQG